MSDEFRIRLLIVDDEQSIRRLCMTVGESLSFACMEADSGETALGFYSEPQLTAVGKSFPWSRFEPSPAMKFRISRMTQFN